MKKADSFITRSFRIGGYSFLAAAIVLALLVAVNVIVDKLPNTITHLDVSSNKMYSLSEQTKKVLKTLDQDVTIYWVCQSGMEDVAVESIIDLYDSASAHIQVKVIDPDTNPKFLEKYTSELLNNSIVIVSGDRDCYIPNDQIYLEEQDYSGNTTYTFAAEDALTKGIYTVVTDNVPKVYVTKGHGEYNLSSDVQNRFWDENMELASLELISYSAIPEDAGIVLVYLPTADITVGEKQVLQNYLADGGKLAIVTGATVVEMPNLHSVLSGYGISSVPGILLESDAKHYSGEVYGLLPTINSHVITEPIISSDENVLAADAHGLKVTQPDNTAVTVTELLTTSSTSYSKVNPQSTTIEQEPGDIAGPFCVGVAVEDASTNAQAVWFSSYYLPEKFAANQDVFFNSLHWMCDQEAMISIRAKDISQAELIIDKDSSNALSWIIILVVPLCYLAVGLIVYNGRKRR